MLTFVKKTNLAAIALLCLFSSCKWFETKTQEQTNKTSEGPMTISPLVNVITSKEHFDQLILQSPRPSIVKFHADWCKFCREMQPIFEELAEEYKNKYTFALVDIDKNKEIADTYNIKGLPTFLFFLDGKERNKEIRVLGVISKDLMRKHIDDYLH